MTNVESIDRQSRRPRPDWPSWAPIVTMCATVARLIVEVFRH